MVGLRRGLFSKRMCLYCNYIIWQLTFFVFQYDWPVAEENKGIRETLMIYQFSYLPAGLFNRTQVQIDNFI